jgi:hypothetical protein
MTFLKVFQFAERGMWLCKKRKVLKNGQVSNISKTMGTQMPTMKKRKKKREKMIEKDNPCSLAKVSKFQTRET